MGEFLGGRNDYGLDFRGETTVRIRNGAFGLEIEHIPYSSYYMLDTKRLAGVDSQVVVLYDPDVVHPRNGLAYYLQTLPVGEESPLVLIDAHGDDDLVEHSQGSFQNVEMSCGKGVE